MSNFGVIGVGLCSQLQGNQAVELLGQLTIDRDSRLEKLQDLARLAGLEEIIYLATCNRVEFYFTTVEAAPVTEIRNRILDFFFNNNSDISFTPNDFYAKSGLDAVDHLFSVASAIESLVIGEAQILGQVKDAFFYASENGLAGNRLSGIFQQAFRVGKKVRTETEMGRRAVSMVSLVTSRIEEVIDTEGSVPVALVGAGEMTHKLARFLKGKSITDILFVNRTVAKAQRLAEQYGGRAISLDQFQAGSERVRVICTATASTTPIFTDKISDQLLANNEKLLFVDLAVPCDVNIENVVENRLEIVNIATLKKISEQNRRQRFRDVDKARNIISAEVDRYHYRMIEDELRPVFNLSFQQAKDYADKGLDRLFDRRLSHLADSDRDEIARMVNKLVSYTTFLPAKALANRMSTQVADDTRAATMPETNRQSADLVAFRKGA